MTRCVTPDALRFAGVLILGMTIGPCAAHADMFAPGDLFVATDRGIIQWRDVSGVNYSPTRVITTGDSGEQAGMRHSPLNNYLWITNFNAGGATPSIRIVDNTGTSVGSASTPAQLDPESIVFDALGNAYVGGPNGALVKLSSTGSVLMNYTVPLTGGAVGPDWIDLASDQRTMFYSYERQVVKRFDLVNNTPLPDFADLSSVMNPGERLYALRLLPDGGLLVAGGRVVYRLNSLGTVIQTYDAPNEDFFFSLALTPDFLSFWTGSLFNNSGTANNVYEFGIASGLVQQSFDAAAPPGGLAVYGDHGVAGVPEPASAVLFCTVGLLFLLVLHTQDIRKRPFTKVFRKL